MEFYVDDVYYLYIENRDEKSVVKLQRDYYWTEEHIDGVRFDLGTLFSQLDIEEIVDSLRKNFDTVEVIDEYEIDNYME
jgi:hypothetical protein